MFAETGYAIARNAVPQILCRFISEQYNLMVANGQLSQDDTQVEKAYYAYGLYVTEALLSMMTPIVEREVGEEVLPTYSYSRIYLNGAELKKHKDRPSCELTTTVALSHKRERPWPICLTDRKGQNVEVDLNPGDMMVYRGLELVHWRAPFEGEWQLQAVLCYVMKNGPHAEHIYDARPRLGAPPVRVKAMPGAGAKSSAT